jgi:hypothetical protein
VHATYCKRPIGDVFEDIMAYADWPNDQSCPGLGVEGVFVDETVNLHSVEAKHYLDSIDEKVKAASSIGGERIVCRTFSSSAIVKLMSNRPFTTPAPPSIPNSPLQGQTLPWWWKRRTPNLTRKTTRSGWPHRRMIGHEHVTCSTRFRIRGLKSLRRRCARRPSTFS